MTLLNAFYTATYEDYNGGDRVPCIVDSDTWEVVAFYPAEECRWEDNVMCIEEWIHLEDGRELPAIKFDEYNDAIAGGYAEESGYIRGEIVLFDADALVAAMEESFPSPTHVPEFPNYFQHCALLAGTIDNEDNAYQYAEELAWRGTEHFRDAALMMKESTTQFENANTADGFYNDLIEKTYQYANAFDELYAQAEALTQQMRNDFRFQGRDEDEVWGRN